ncbi:MAG: phospho-N-acetylmuramoyl-pentapeptide-transferase [Deltaproteobacteria bacterium]|nr:phospho-N-acetylmuramoyl-pentapeptide-transferase [Deltaproteobacteria bacterium]
MIYLFLYPLHTIFSFFNVFRYITFRTIYAGLTAFLICCLLCPWIIKKLKKVQIKQFIREEGPRSHQIKAGTPTMGGLLILFSIVTSTLLWADLTNKYIVILIVTAIIFGLIGFIDDYSKQVKKKNKGLSAKSKFLLQTLIGILIGILIWLTPDFSTKITFPFFKNFTPDFGILHILFAAFVIVGSSNAVNLTDGLDGLAIGLVIITGATYMLFAYVTGHINIAEYLQINYVPGCGEVAVFCGALAGAGLGFLWFNTYPAQIFMGDTGSLSLGALIGAIAVITKQEFILVIVGGLFVLEALSVIIQVSFFKISNGKRLFKMAPLHHHFELKGWAEPKIIARFWIISIILALISISTLKLR